MFSRIQGIVPKVFGVDVSDEDRKYGPRIGPARATPSAHEPEESPLKPLISSFPIALCVFSLAAGCDNHPATPAAARAAPPPAVTADRDPHGSAPAGGPAAVGHAAAPSGATARGTVREAMNAGGYTYMRIETAGGGSSWAATMEMPLAVGDEVQVEGGNEMVDFHSRSLNRTFPQITFASGVRVVNRGNGAPAAAAAVAAAPAVPGAGAAAGGAMPPGHPPVGAGAGAAPGAGTAAAEPPAAGGTRGVVRETMNAATYTYMRIETASGSTWVAVPQMTVAVGDQVEAAAGNEMPGFHSRTLDRTFEQITFAPAARVLGAGGARPAAAPGATPATPTAAPAVPAAAHPTGTPGALPPGHSGAMPAGHPPV